MMCSISCTVIIPVYNVCPYLDEAIQSVRNQMRSDIEIILVDDGSTDNSGDICDHYASIDNRVVVCHQENAGVSAARNKGIDMANGEYLCFVDGDDIIDSDMIATLYEYAKTHNVDLVLSTHNRKVLKPQRKSDSISISPASKVLSDYFRFQNLLDSHGLLRTNIVRQVKYSPDIHFWEDYAFMVVLLSKCKSVAITKNDYYYYRDREGSANHAFFSEKILSCVKIADYLHFENIFRTKKERETVSTFFIAQCLYYMQESSQRVEDQLLRKYRRCIIQNIFSIIRSKGIIPRRKIKAILAIMCVAPNFGLKLNS